MDELRTHGKQEVTIPSPCAHEIPSSYHNYWSTIAYGVPAPYFDQSPQVRTQLELLEWRLHSIELRNKPYRYNGSCFPPQSTAAYCTRLCLQIVLISPVLTLHTAPMPVELRSLNNSVEWGAARVPSFGTSAGSSASTWWPRHGREHGSSSIARGGC